MTSSGYLNILTTKAAKLIGGELNRVRSTGVTAGQPFGCPIQPTIEFLARLTTLKNTLAACDMSRLLQAGCETRHLILQMQINYSA
ncbi:hypothetical protein [Arsenophonus nasoniae]|uniref:Uncharacterized protein n=1 Tax=Arsenophonus nasoniae TaxID=638 RepID=A0AA95K4M9_9GAMM|nr:hypothetical protein [Arsenophonus nasoniae]WGM00245.1 hypothetical protein QE210_10115 [Arsenophonus nasoniae]